MSVLVVVDVVVGGVVFAVRRCSLVVVEFAQVDGASYAVCLRFFKLALFGHLTPEIGLKTC